MCYASRQLRRRHWERLILARLKLHLHPHVAGDRDPDERVSLSDVGMRSKLGGYIKLLAEHSFSPTANGPFVADESAKRLLKQADPTWCSAAVPGRSSPDTEPI
jgi:hypothetical protein